MKRFKSSQKDLFLALLYASSERRVKIYFHPLNFKIPFWLHFIQSPSCLIDPCTFHPGLLHICLTRLEVINFLSWGKSFTPFKLQFSSHYLHTPFSNFAVPCKHIPSLKSHCLCKLLWDNTINHYFNWVSTFWHELCYTTYRVDNNYINPRKQSLCIL